MSLLDLSFLICKMGIKYTLYKTVKIKWNNTHKELAACFSLTCRKERIPACLPWELYCAHFTEEGAGIEA